MSAGFPIGVYSRGGQSRIGALVGGAIVDVASILPDREFAHDTLHPFLSRGKRFWDETMERLSARADDAPRIPLAAVEPKMPFEVADFIDFYSSLEHAVNAGKILRPTHPELPPAWREIPIGYHARAGTVVVSGTPIRRPRGLIAVPGDRASYLPSRKLDVEVELGFVVGAASTPGEPVPIGRFEDCVFGVVILLDWSARDIQSFEAQPLGPFLGKSFATTISPWVVPLSLLGNSRVAGPAQDPEPRPHLRRPPNANYDIRLELWVNGRLISRPEFSRMYWSPAQQFAHITSNGASLRVGDIYGSGTISSYDPPKQGSLLELTNDGASPMQLAHGEVLGYLRDGDVVTVTAEAHGGDDQPLDFGWATGKVLE